MYATQVKNGYLVAYPAEALYGRLGKTTGMMGILADAAWRQGLKFLAIPSVWMAVEAGEAEYLDTLQAELTKSGVDLNEMRTAYEEERAKRDKEDAPISPVGMSILDMMGAAVPPLRVYARQEREPRIEPMLRIDKRGGPNDAPKRFKPTKGGRR
jgi:hypothetical protein